MGPETTSEKERVRRELNPQLFGGGASASEQAPRAPAAPMLGGAEAKSRAVPYPPVDIKSLESSIMGLKSSISMMEKRTEALAFKMEELARNVHTRLERFSQAILRVEEAQSKTNAETAQKLAGVFAKVNERKVTDNKVQELLDRHNTVVRNFENRLLSLQRVVTEQEMALHNAQAALEDARHELARLKR